MRGFFSLDDLEAMGLFVREVDAADLVALDVDFAVGFFLDFAAVVFSVLASFAEVSSDVLGDSSSTMILQLGFTITENTNNCSFVQ